MSHNSNVQITYCTFPPPVPTSKFYTCYRREVCCPQGCCLNGSYQIYLAWYYWLVFLVIFGIISGASWFCKRPRNVLCRAVSRTPQGSCTHSACTRRCAGYLENTEERQCRNCEGTRNSPTDFEDNIILDRLFVSFRNRNTLGDPPSYSSILSSDCGNKLPSKFCPLYSYYGPPPTYSSMYKLSEENSQTIANENTAPHTSATAPSIAEIQVHAEAQDSRSSANNSDQNVNFGNVRDGVTASSSDDDINNADTNRNPSIVTANNQTIAEDGDKESPYRPNK